MKNSELRALSLEELQKKLIVEKDNLEKLIFSHAATPIENPMKIKVARKFVARIKGDDRKGTVSSFFTYWKGPGWNRGGWSEIDIELVPSSTEGTVSTNLIWTN